MNTYADKTRKNESPTTNVLSNKKRDNESTFHCPNALAQRKLQNMANNISEVKQSAQLHTMVGGIVQMQPAANLSRVLGRRNIGRLRMFFGGTGRGARESFNMPTNRELHRVNPIVNAMVDHNEETGDAHLTLLANGPAFTDPSTGHLHGYERPGSFYERFQANVLGRGGGTMTLNSEAMLEAIHSISERIPPDAPIDMMGYSRGAVSAARSLPALTSMLPQNTIHSQLFDPVAGPLDQRTESAHGTDTRVQYSLDNGLPGFWATPISEASGIVLAQGGHSTATRGNYGRLPDLHSLPTGVHIEENQGELLHISRDDALRRLQSLHEQAGSYFENPHNASRYFEIQQAIRKMTERTR